MRPGRSTRPDEGPPAAPQELNQGREDGKLHRDRLDEASESRSGERSGYPREMTPVGHAPPPAHPVTRGQVSGLVARVLRQGHAAW